MLLSQAQDPSREIFLWLGAIIGAAIVLGVVAMVLRKLLIGREEPAAIGFTLADLRDLHAKGEISDEEFAQAKGRMIAQNRAMLVASEDDAADDTGPDAPGPPGFGEGSANPVDESGPGDGSPDKNP